MSRNVKDRFHPINEVAALTHYALLSLTEPNPDRGVIESYDAAMREELDKLRTRHGLSRATPDSCSDDRWTRPLSLRQLIAILRRHEIDTNPTRFRQKYISGRVDAMHYHGDHFRYNFEHLLGVFDEPLTEQFDELMPSAVPLSQNTQRSL